MPWGRRRKTSQVSKPTNIGELFPSRVAFAAVRPQNRGIVECQVARKKYPSERNNALPDRLLNGSSFLPIKNVGRSIAAGINIRENAETEPGISVQRTKMADHPMHRMAAISAR